MTSQTNNMLDVLSKLYTDLKTESALERLSYITDLARTSSVLPYRLRKSFKYLEDRGMATSVRKGVERFYELTPSGEKIMWWYSEFVEPTTPHRISSDVLNELIEDSTTVEKQFDSQLNLTHSINYNRALAITRLQNLPLPKITLVRWSDFGASYDIKMNQIKLRLAVTPLGHLNKILLHEDTHSLQDKKNNYMQEEYEKVQKADFDVWKMQDAIIIIFKEGFAQFIAGKDNTDKLRYIYGHEIFETIGLAKGHDTAIGFGLYERPTLKNIENEYLECCRILNKRPRMKLKEAVVAVSKKVRFG